MKPNSIPNPGQTKTSGLHPLVLACAALVLGIALTAIWFHHHDSGSPNDRLSDSTKNLLGQLAGPVAIHYYALLPASSADESLQSFAGRVTQLLDTVQAAGGGKIQLSSFSAVAETNVAAARADGLQPFNLDKGDACFLGLVITSGKNSEAFARLQPEWEPALEFDLARAIQRVAATAAPARPAPEVARPSPEIMASINRLIPDVNAVSAEQADQIFQAEFLKQCGEISTEMETKINAAQQQAAQAQSSGSRTEQEAAQKNLLEMQLVRAEKFKDLAAQMQIQQAVFRRMKTGATSDAH